MGMLGLGSSASSSVPVASLMSFTSSSSSSSSPSTFAVSSSSSAPRPLLSEAASGGLSVTYSFPRRASSFGEQFIVVSLVFSNEGSRALSNIRVRADDLPNGQELIACADIPSLTPGASQNGLLNIRFSSVRTPLKFQILHDGRASTVTLNPEVGEVLSPLPLSKADFLAAQTKLGGMLEASTSVPVGSLSGQAISGRILGAANLHLVEQQESSAALAGTNLLTGKPVLVSYSVAGGMCSLVLNSEDSMFSPILSTRISQALTD